MIFSDMQKHESGFFGKKGTVKSRYKLEYFGKYIVLCVVQTRLFQLQ